MVRHWPQSGDQSDTWGSIGRRFADAGVSSTEIGSLVEGLAKLVGADWRAAKDTVVNVAETFDLSSLKELFGAAVAERLDRFLGATEVIEDETRPPPTVPPAAARSGRRRPCRGLAARSPR
jgi:hypothetical protein